MSFPLEHLVLLSRSGQLSRVFKLVWEEWERLSLEAERIDSRLGELKAI